jgi:hypothetical protein
VCGIDAAHKFDTTDIGLTQQGRNIVHNIGLAFKQKMKNITGMKHVRFSCNTQVHIIPSCHEAAATVMVIYNSGADGHYTTKTDQVQAQLPILRKASKRVAVANGETCKAKFVTHLPFHTLSTSAQQAKTFTEFPHSLMSVGKTAINGMISIFAKKGVMVHKEQDILITCKGKPILIGVRDDHGRYRIPLVQQRGQWQPRHPSKKAQQALWQANSVYNLPSTEQAVKWMHVVCGYPVKSTWTKAIKAGNFVGWPILTERNVNTYYPDTDKISKGHMNQTRKNVRSTKHAPMESCNSKEMHGKKVRNVYVKVYDARETTFSDQTGQFPTRSKSGNKYITVMVEIDSNSILVEPLKCCKDAELICGYNALLLRLRRAGIVPQKCVINNEISKTMNNHICNKCKLTLELVPPGCHCRNAAEVAIRNFKSHFLSILAGVAGDFPPSFFDRLLPQTEITLNLLHQSNAFPSISAYTHLSGPFNYNKMPLAPMGCEVQVHKKTDKQGTWAYRSVDGWYLSTLPDHYCMHLCHIKNTNSNRLLNTVHFKHKHITNPTLTHADKIMRALSHCAQVLKGKDTTATNQELGGLQRLVEVTQANLLQQARSNSKLSLSSEASPPCAPNPYAKVR